MKYIRIKAKYLIIIAILIIGIINVRNLQLFGYRSLGLVNKDLSSELIENMKVTDIKSANAQLESVISGINTTIYNPVIMGDGGGFAAGSKVSYKDGKEVYEKYLTFSGTEKKNEAFYDYAINVSLMLWFGELPDEAINILNEIDTTKLSALRLDEYRLIKSTYLLSLLKLDEAMTEIGKMQNHYPLIQEQVTEFINALQHNESIPREYNVGTYSEEERKIYSLYSNICDNYYLDSSQELSTSDEETIDSEVMSEDEARRDVPNSGVISSDKKIKGFITYNEQPLQGVIVYLKSNDNIFGGIKISRYFAVTDENGYYELEAYEGDNFLRIAIPWQLAHDKQLQCDVNRSGIEFDNNIATMNYAFNDAAYIKGAEVKDGRLYYEMVDPMYEDGRLYRISLDYAKSEYSRSSNNYFDIDEGDMERLPGGRIRGSIDLETLRHKMRIRYSYMGGMDDFQLMNFLEPLYLSGEYTLGVMIREEKQESSISNGIFSESVLYRQFIEGEELSEGDKLIEKGDMEGALHWFEEHQSVHGLKVLTSLYEKGYYDEEDDGEFSYHHDGIDLDKAILYAKKLLDIEPNERFYESKLQNLYEDAGRYEEALTMLEHRMESNPDEVDQYNHFVKGRLLIKLGQYEEGIKEYLNYADSVEDEDRFYAYLILGNHIEDMRSFYQEQFEDIDRDDFHEFFDLMNDGRYEEAYSKLSEKDDSDLKTFYTLLFEKEFSNYRQNEDDLFIDHYVEISRSLESQRLQRILEELVKYNGWFD